MQRRSQFVFRETSVAVGVVLSQQSGFAGIVELFPVLGKTCALVGIQLAVAVGIIGGHDELLRPESYGAGGSVHGMPPGCSAPGLSFSLRL